MSKGPRTTGDALSDRVPPNSIDTELAVLGAMMLSPDAIDTAATMINKDDFYRESHGLVFEAIIALRERGHEVDVLSVKDSLESRNLLERAGGAGALIEAQNACTSATSIKTYCDIVRKKAVSRRLITVGTEIAASGWEAQDAPDDAVADGMNKMMGLAMVKGQGAISLESAFLEFVNELMSGKREYISPPFLPWVHVKWGSLVVLAAGTSVGKTMVSLDWADAWSQIYPTMYLEYEMNEASLAARLGAKYAGISMVDMENEVTPEEMDLLLRVHRDVMTSRKLYVEAMRSDGSAALFAKIRKAASIGVKVVFIDHLGLVPIKVPSGMNHAKAVGMELTNKLKRLALELGIVIVVLAQLNRGGQMRMGKDRHPVLQDLRDSGEIEQDADVVVMLAREARRTDDPTAAMTAREEAGLPGDFEHDLMWAGVRKNRNGGLGHVYMGAIPGQNLLFDPHNDPYAEVSDIRRALTKGIASKAEQGVLV